jgi:hypothetical protein
MRLFKGYAVMPRTAGAREHTVRAYLVVAGDWREARASIGRREPGAQLVTVPDEMPQPFMMDIRSIDAREFSDLYSACVWNEAHRHTYAER